MDNKFIKDLMAKNYTDAKPVIMNRLMSKIGSKLTEMRLEVQKNYKGKENDK